MCISLGTNAEAQRTVLEYQTFAVVSDPDKPIVDISADLIARCDKRLQQSLNGVTVEVHFGEGSSTEAVQILNKLVEAVRLTQEMLTPLVVPDVRFYLMSMAEVPANFSAKVLSEGNGFYLHVLPISDRRELDLECSQNNEICSDIYLTIPHELSHRSLDRIVQRDARWFDEGLAEYASIKVATVLAPEIARTRLRAYLPRESLHRREIRENIIRWQPFKYRDLKRMNELEIRNDFFFYGAAYQILEYAFANGTDTRRSGLLPRIQSLRNVKKRPISNKELLSVVENELGNGIRSLGVVPETEQIKYVRQAEDVLRPESKNATDHYEALYRLAVFDDISLSRETIESLIDLAFQQSAPHYFSELAATAITRRLRRENFKSFIATYLSSTSKQQKVSIRKLVDGLKKKSIRPL
ncbi:MAG: hypothetical protein KF831_07160 [Acidobacteria bacterium]|nr:hypothetical protein [Acidobacteriota bacterium]